MRQVAVSIHLLGLTLLSVGKWVYEVLISSQGLMQIGWCTINCRFNQEVHTREGALPKRVFCCRRPQNSSQSHSGACLIRAAPSLRMDYAPFYSRAPSRHVTPLL